MEEEADQYDEFGNYIGPIEEINGNFSMGPEDICDDLNKIDTDTEHQNYTDTNLINYNHPSSSTTAVVVPNEDKKYFPSAMEIYGESVQVMVEDEDAQALTEPIIAPIKEILVDSVAGESNVPVFKYSLDYHMELLNVPERCRNVSVVGHLHHGKTSLLDLLVSHCHTEEPVKPRSTTKTPNSRDQLPRYLDSLTLEQERGISLRAKPLCILLNNFSTDTSYAVNLLDCPGHADFREDVGVGLSLLSENVLLVVDCVEGVQVESEATLKTALNLNHSLVLVLTKIERLWLELKLPPMDAYYKLKHTIDKLNTLAGKCLFAPELGNVIFASSLGGYAFTLQSFVQLKYSHLVKNQNPQSLARRLWGDCYYSNVSKAFTKTPQDSAPKRTFVTFILEPLYKIYTQTLSATSSDSLKSFVTQHLGNGKETILNMKQILKMNPRPLLKRVLSKFFCDQPILGLVDTLTGTLMNCSQCLSTNTNTSNNNSDTDTLMSICKVYPPSTIKTNNKLASIDQPRVLCRLWQGRIYPGQVIKIHGSDTEESLEAQVAQVFIPCTRYELPVSSRKGTSAPWVLLTGIPLDRIIKYGTVTDGTDKNSTNSSDPPRIFIPNTASFLRVSIEPLVPSELPKMLQVLRLLSVLYSSLQTHVEESGEHVLIGPGELYLDSVLHDLRSLGQLQIRLSDPSASLTESVSEVSTLKCYADTANGRIRITMLAEPMEKGLAELIESVGTTTAKGATTAVAVSLPSETILMEKFGWDRLSCRSVLSVSVTGGNVLLDDTFNELAPGLLDACRSSLIQGFQWAVREGPLCEEPIRAVKFRLLDLKILDDQEMSLSALSPAQIVPATRRCCYASFLTASPRLLEPIQNLNILTPGECVEVIYGILARRRGHILADTPLAGTPLYTIQALLPLLDSPGFEVDLRSMTGGAAMPHSTFSHWQAIPGDPLDQTIPAALLEPATPPALARDCLLKMRRRRGIGEDVKLDKYFDPEILDLLRKQ